LDENSRNSLSTLFSTGHPRKTNSKNYSWLNSECKTIAVPVLEKQAQSQDHL
jgi:hypothetical protein